MKTEIEKWKVVPVMKNYDGDSPVSDYSVIEYEGVKVAVLIKVAQGKWRALLMSNVHLNYLPWGWGSENVTPLSDEYHKANELITAIRERFDEVMTDLLQ